MTRKLTDEDVRRLRAAARDHGIDAALAIGHDLGVSPVTVHDTVSRISHQRVPDEAPPLSSRVAQALIDALATQDAEYGCDVVARGEPIAVIRDIASFTVSHGGWRFTVAVRPA